MTTDPEPGRRRTSRQLLLPRNVARELLDFIAAVIRGSLVVRSVAGFDGLILWAHEKPENHSKRCCSRLSVMPFGHELGAVPDAAKHLLAHHEAHDLDRLNEQPSPVSLVAVALADQQPNGPFRPVQDHE